MAPKSGKKPAEKTEKPVEEKKVEKVEKPAKEKAAPAKAKPKPEAKAAKAAPKKKSSQKKSEGKGPEANRYVGVHIKNLDFEGINKESVQEIFKQCPKIYQVRIRTGHHVLIFFDGAAGAKKALEMNGKTVYGNKIAVKIARNATPEKPREKFCKTVWVGDLPGGATKQQLQKHFEEAGKIIKVRVYDRKHMGFVYFTRPSDAIKAVGLAEKPFTYGKDVSKLDTVPPELQRKLQVKLSIRSKKFDKSQAAKRFNRRPPSQIDRDRIKSENRKNRRAALKKAEAAKAKEGSSTKKGSATKKSGSATKKAGSGTKKAGSATKKAGSGTKKAQK